MTIPSMTLAIRSSKFSFIRLSSLAFALSLVATATICQQESQAMRSFLRGPRGVAGAFASQGANGARAGARLLGRNNGAGWRAGTFNGPNGGSISTAHAFGYSRGVGAFRAKGWQGQGPNGGSGQGGMSNIYNAQTGQGQKTRTEQLQTASGQNYGFTDTSTYTKGQGGTSVIQTDNHGTYDVNF